MLRKDLKTFCVLPLTDNHFRSSHTKNISMNATAASTIALYGKSGTTCRHQLPTEPHTRGSPTCCMQPYVSSGVHAIADADVSEAQYIQAIDKTPLVPPQPLLYIQAIGRAELALQASMRACCAPSDTLKDARTSVVQRK